MQIGLFNLAPQYHMDQNGNLVIDVTAPTGGIGKTVEAADRVHMVGNLPGLILLVSTGTRTHRGRGLTPAEAVRCQEIYQETTHQVELSGVTLPARPFRSINGLLPLPRLNYHPQLYSSLGRGRPTIIYISN